MLARQMLNITLEDVWRLLDEIEITEDGSKELVHSRRTHILLSEKDLRFREEVDIKKTVTSIRQASQSIILPIE